MKASWFPAVRVLVTLTAGMVLVAGPVQASPFLADGSAPPAETAEQALASELQRDPVGIVVGNRIYRPDGSVFVAMDAGTFSLSQCDSGQWCMWTETYYTGSFSYRTGSGVTYYLSGTVRSVWNNRSRAARLYSNSGASSTCYSADARSSSLSSSYTSPSKVYLSSGGC